MKASKIVSVLLVLMSTTSIFAQEAIPVVKSNKGKVYAFWGWNRGWYSNSDIHFQGDNYDFVLNNVKAKDRPSPYDLSVYFNPTTITIPQTNYGIGYFITEKIDVSISVDHMKYVMIKNQKSTITGEINNSTEFEGNYNSADIFLTEEFLKFEHTDGLNYINAEITYTEDFLKMINIRTNSNKFELGCLVGFGMGGMMPKSNVTLMGGLRNDEFHWAGYALAAKVGTKLTFYRTFFIRSEYKAGFTNLTDIRTTSSETDRARQYFLFSELNFTFGFAIHPFN